MLIEKAFTRNAAEARSVLDLAAARGVFVAEAMWARYLPHYDVVCRAVESGLLGSLHTIIADHGQRLYPHGPQRLSDPQLAGGALLDLGVYPLAFAAMLMPVIERVSATGTVTSTGVDAQEAITLIGASPGAEGGVTASLTATMLGQTANTAVVAGNSARIELDGWFYQPTTLRLVDPDEGVLDVRELDPADKGVGLRYEAAEVARRITAGERETPQMSHAETLRIMAIMDEVRRQIGVAYPGEKPA